ncbi:TonB-dependent siderophore receptor [Pleionea sp. CnH1-48]|uniref:TonB-dependent receptor plug domain-containing protein n=1 Tax=Pleionea sp. CnH1-48 TaxID=2954494 RepID=UPI00209749E5|nr:TonB-dependent receptor [Pleionea sp. CnH1-48]MCO7226997.1 TonB-dependent receptor [Pleionea sp. CnH1-48]
MVDLERNKHKLFACVLVFSLPVWSEEPLSFEETLDMSFDELLQLPVSSTTKTDIRFADVPAVLSIITSDDLEKYQYDSVAESLKSQAGLDVLYDYTFYNVGIRGINGGQGIQSGGIKAMIDGQDMSYRTTTSSFLGPEFIPTIAIDRIEVIRGPMSALYGADAFLGLVNVLPKTARSMSQEKQNFLVDVDAVDIDGSFGKAAEMAIWGMPSDFDIFAAISSQSLQRNDVNLPESSPRFDNINAARGVISSDSEDKSTSLYLAISKDSGFGQLTFDASYQYIDRSANFHPDSEPLMNARQVLDNYMARLRFKKDLSDQWALSSSLSINKGSPKDSSRFYDPFRVGIDYINRDYSFEQITSAIDLNYLFNDDLNFVFGLDYSFDTEELPTLNLYDTNGNLTQENANRKIEIDNLGAFAQVAWQIQDNLHLTAGVRSDDHSIYDSEHSYRTGIVYHYSPVTTFKLLSGSSFKAPPVMLMFGGEHPRLLGPSPNANLKPQEANTTEIFIGTQFFKQINAGLTLYQTKVNEFAEYDTIASNPQARNRGEIEAYGLELELKYQSKSGIDAFFNLSSVETKVSTDTQVGIQVSDQTRLYPQTILSTGISKKLKALPLRWFITSLYIDERAADKSNLPFLPIGSQQEYFLPSYNIVDLGIATFNWYPLGNNETQVRLKLKNALDKRYVEPGFGGIDVPGIGREIRLSFSQIF